MPKPLLLGIVGHPLGHSLSPKLHGAALKYANLVGEYRLFDIESDALHVQLDELIAGGLNGFNVTIPHKVEIFKRAAKLTSEAILVGAVNTVRVEADHSLTAHNTDARGLLEACRELSPTDFAGKSGLLIGCGGSAQAALKVACDLGLEKVAVLGRNSKKVEIFIAGAKKRFASSESARERNFGERICRFENKSAEDQIVFHTTPIGLKAEEIVPDWLVDVAKQLPKDAIVLDLVYHKDQSPPAFAKLTASMGLTTADGVSMLVHQARLAFEFWTGVSVPAEVMKASLMAA